MVLHVRTAMSRQGRRLAEMLDTDAFTLYVGGTRVNIEGCDETSDVRLLLGDRPTRFRATPIGTRRYQLAMPSGELVTVGVTRRLDA